MSDDFDDDFSPEPDDGDFCPHGKGFDEDCEECDELMEDEL